MRRLSEQDIRLWRKVASSVRPLAGRTIPAEPSPSLPKAQGPDISQALRVPDAPVQPSANASPAPLADVSNTRKVRRGQTPIEGRLDLHGHTQDSAYRELVGFISHHRAQGSRVVLVITGKGRTGGGVLRSRFLDWIDGPDVRPLLAGYAPAHAKHGGSGAFYLVLKARRGP